MQVCMSAMQTSWNSVAQMQTIFIEVQMVQKNNVWKP